MRAEPLLGLLQIVDRRMLAVAGPMLYVQLLLCGWAESKRWLDYKNPGSQGDGSFFGITEGFKGQSNGYPGTAQ